MPRSASPKRYAQAVFQLALDKGELEQWQGDLRVLAVTLDDRQLSGLLDAPQVPSASKVEVARQTLTDSVGPLAVNLVCVLALKSLVHLVPNILEEYGRLLDRHNGIERAEVVSAVPLDGVQESRMAELLEGVVGKKVRITSFVEPEIIGGLVARVSDRVIDGSVRAKLSEMRKEIAQHGS